MRFWFATALVVSTCLSTVVAHAQGLPFTGGAAASEPPLPPPYATRQAEVEIPFSVKASEKPSGQPVRVLVYVSWDRGANWHFFEERKPSDGRFRFRAKRDGEFWFSTHTVEGTAAPPAGNSHKAQLRLIVDTQKPQLGVQVEPAGANQLTLAFSAIDANLNPGTFRLEYQDTADLGAPWQEITVDRTHASPAIGTLTGRVTATIQARSRTINLRAEVADAAGNVGYYTQQVRISENARPAPPPQMAAAPVDPSSRPWPTDNLLPPSPSGAGSDPAMMASQRPAAQPEVMTNPFTSPGRNDRLASSPSAGIGVESLPPPPSSAQEYAQQNSQQNSQPSEMLPPPTTGSSGGDSSFRPSSSERQPGYGSAMEDSSQSRPLPSDTPLPPEFENAPSPGSSPNPGFTPAPAEALPSEEVLPAPLPAPSRDVAPSTGRSPAPQDDLFDAPTRLTNSKRFTLDYDVETVGPEGIAEVELWGTNDGGQTWMKWGTDPDRTSPMDVEVAGEANYGFRVVIVGRNGLIGNQPKSGDPADIWVGIDTTKPTARITQAAYGSGDQAGRLDIRWEAADAHLLSRPITIAMSDRAEGPFTPIAAGLPNTGQYFWEFDPRSPRQIFLRIEVRDSAGNITIEGLREPISVEGLTPRGRIRSFQPAPENQQGAFRSPLFR